MKSLPIPEVIILSDEEIEGNLKNHAKSAITGEVYETCGVFHLDGFVASKVDKVRPDHG